MSAAFFMCSFGPAVMCAVDRDRIAPQSLRSKQARPNVMTVGSGPLQRIFDERISHPKDDQPPSSKSTWSHEQMSTFLF